MKPPCAAARLPPRGAAPAGPAKPDPRVRWERRARCVPVALLHLAVPASGYAACNSVCPVLNWRRAACCPPLSSLSGASDCSNAKQAFLARRTAGLFCPALGCGKACWNVNCTHALGQSLTHRLRGQLVCWPFLFATHLREPADGGAGLGGRARPAAADGAQAASLYHFAGGACAGPGCVAVDGLWHRPGPCVTGKWLDARQAGRGGAGDRLPPRLRRAAAQAGRRHLPQEPRVVPLVQRGACAAAAAAVVLVVVKPF